MSNEETLTKAIGGHGLWKSRLIEAVETGHSDFDPEDVKVDNKCEFGQWLHYDIDPGLKSDPHYSQAVSLHATFHRYAANILREATTGSQSTASEMLSRRSDYSELSIELTLALMEWREELANLVH